MQLKTMIFIVLVGIVAITASPIPTHTTEKNGATTKSSSPKSLRDLILSSGGTVFRVSKEQTTSLPNTDELTTPEKTTESPLITTESQATTSDVTDAHSESQSTELQTTIKDVTVRQQMTTQAAGTSESETSAPVHQTRLFRRERSLTTESPYETTAILFTLNKDLLVNTMFACDYLMGQVDMKLADMRTEADYDFTFDLVNVLLTRPVLEATLEVDSDNCINIQETLIEVVQILDSFSPYVDAMNNMITVSDLRDNVVTLAGPAVIPTSGSDVQVLSSTQETIYTLLALQYQNKIFMNVLHNLLTC